MFAIEYEDRKKSRKESHMSTEERGAEAQRKRMATATAYLAQLVMIDAPPEVINPLKNWCNKLKSELPEQQGGIFRQGMAVSDSATVEVVDVRRKN